MEVHMCEHRKKKASRSEKSSGIKAKNNEVNRNQNKERRGKNDSTSASSNS